MLLLRLSGLLLLRLATRTFLQLLLKAPPRNTLFSAYPHAAAGDAHHVAAVTHFSCTCAYALAFCLALLRFQPPMSRPISSMRRAACSSCPRLMQCVS